MAKKPKTPENVPSESAGIITRQRTLLLMLLLVVGGGLSALLMLDHHGVSFAQTAVDQVCGEGDDSGCAEVAQSAYSTFGGVSLAAIGLFFYSSILLLTCISLPGGWELRPSTAALLLGLLASAVVLDVVLLGVQAFALGAFCKLCLATYAVNIAGVALLLPAKPHLSSVAESFSAPAGKMTLTAWGLASLMLFVSIGMAEYSLAAQKSQLAANILGSPAAPPASNSAAAASRDRIVPPEKPPAPWSWTRSIPGNSRPGWRRREQRSLVWRRHWTTLNFISSMYSRRRPRSSSKRLPSNSTLPI